MRAMLLVGGRGTRLRPLTFAVPKPLLAVGDKPMLQLMIERLKAGGCREVILATGYLSELIEAFCGDGSRFGVEISYVRERSPLGTAGPLSLVRDRVAPHDFLVVANGDVVTDLAFDRLLGFARERDFELTVGCATVAYESPYGVLEVDGDEVRDVTEKPTYRFTVSGGIYVVKGSAIGRVPEQTPFSMPELMRSVRGAGERVGAFPIEGYWRGVEELGHFDEVRQTFSTAEADAGGAG